MTGFTYYTAFILDTVLYAKCINERITWMVVSLFIRRLNRERLNFALRGLYEKWLGEINLASLLRMKLKLNFIHFLRSFSSYEKLHVIFNTVLQLINVYKFYIKLLFLYIKVKVKLSPCFN
jgi:hypothetical protein